GVFRGFLTISVASTLGATASFAIARYLARDAVASKLAGRGKLHAIDQALADRGFCMVGLLRLSPIAPYNVLNYALGLTRVSMRDYVLGSWLGMMPGTLLYVYVGSLAGDIASTDSSRQSRSPLEWGLYLGGLGVTVLTAIYIARVARNAIREAERSNAE
ncbi:MAG: TVP38/TMEM64 family protein, partial [Candidatus Hydrogenedentales bacterium]